MFEIDDNRNASAGDPPRLPTLELDRDLSVWLKSVRERDRIAWEKAPNVTRIKKSMLQPKNAVQRIIPVVAYAIQNNVNIVYGHDNYHTFFTTTDNLPYE